MAHEFDSGLYRNDRAWHGLGMVVNEDLTARQAVDTLGMGWDVEQYPIYAKAPDGTEIPVPSHYLNVHSETGYHLGLVGQRYRVFTNAELADFCDLLVKGADRIVVESCGSIRHGKKVWFLLRGESFSVKGDEISPYIAVTNGFDGGTLLRFQPTGIRIVCSNTWHLVAPSVDTGQDIPQSYCVRHSGDLTEKLDDVRRALGLYEHAKEYSRKRAEELADQTVNHEKIKDYFFRTYSELIQEIPVNPQDKVEERRLGKAMSAFAHFSRRFDDEHAVSGANAWTMFNAFSGTIQHDMKARGKDDVTRVESRIQSNLFGLNLDRTSRAFELACEMSA